MGYGEFGGGGSVDWRVVHGDKVQKAKDKDPQPVGTGGQFRIYVNDTLVGNPVNLEGNRVLVVWDPDTKQTADDDLRDKKSKDPKPGA